MWLDDARIPFVDENIKNTNHKGDKYANFKDKKLQEVFYTENTKGRFTPNLLVCDDMLNDGSVSQNNKKNKDSELQYDNNAVHKFYKKVGVSRFNDKGTNSRYYDLDLWFDKMLEGL